ncbi:unnamed protein product [Caenorhabditis nigoni]
MDTEKDEEWFIEFRESMRRIILEWTKDCKDCQACRMKVEDKEKAERRAKRREERRKIKEKVRKQKKVWKLAQDRAWAAKIKDRRYRKKMRNDDNEWEREFKEICDVYYPIIILILCSKKLWDNHCERLINLIGLPHIHWLLSLKNFELYEEYIDEDFPLISDSSIDNLAKSISPHSRKCVKGLAIAAGATVVIFLCVGVGIIIHYNFF